jgi:hypothetical protein
MNLGAFDTISGPIRDKDYPTYSDALLDWYKTKNVKSVRLMFTWEAVQSELLGTVPSTELRDYLNYWEDLTSVLARLLARDIYVILCPWQYNPASNDTDIVYRGRAFQAPEFGDFWAKFAIAINGITGNDQRVAFDLINEPHTHAESGNKSGDIGISLSGWFFFAQVAVSYIRSVGATNTIFIPGMGYADANSFITNGSATEWLKIQDAGDIAVTAHCYTGLGSSSPTVLRDACSALVTWARNNGLKANIGEIAIDAGDNGRPIHCSDLVTAQAQWADWSRFNVESNDVLVGWCWWANSAADWWNQGDSCDPDGFHWGLTLDEGDTQTIYMDLIEATLSVPGGGQELGGLIASKTFLHFTASINRLGLPELGVPQKVTLTNEGVSPVTISSRSLNSQEFSDSLDVPTTVVPGETLPFVVSFSPVGNSEPRDALLTIELSDGAPSILIRLEGTVRQEPPIHREPIDEFPK